MKLLFIFPTIIFLILFNLCNAPTKEIEVKEKEKAPIVFQVSDEHKSYFVDLTKNEYSDKEMTELFSKRKELAKTVCEMVYNQKKYSKEVVYTFLNKEIFDKDPFKTWHHPVPKLIAGCWNFFKLNDVHPNRDFALVQKLYGNESKDCFTVGYMQAYLMHNTLGCKNLTMLDLDWRILEGHKQLLDLFKEKAFSTEEQINTSLSKLKLGWLARFDDKPMEAETKTDLHSLCFGEHHKMCKNILLDFQKNMESIDTIYLKLSALHSSDFKMNTTNTKIIYLSNAIDDIYTSKKQFEEMMDKTSNALAKDQKAVFVHHAAGRALFGIYELRKSDTGHELKTICKDKYLTTPVMQTTSEYTTHFEKFSINSKTNIPLCSTLL